MILCLHVQVTFGVFGYSEYIVSEPISPKEIVRVIYEKCMPFDPVEAVLQQEVWFVIFPRLYNVNLCFLHPQMLKRYKYYYNSYVHIAVIVVHRDQALQPVVLVITFCLFVQILIYLGVYISSQYHVAFNGMLRIRIG